MNIITIIQKTPLWVWAVFLYLLIMGAQALKSKSVPLFRLLISPVIFVTWSLLSISQKYGLTIITAGWWALFLVVGLGVGYQMGQRLIMAIDVKNRLVVLAGTIVPLLLSITFFAVKYFLNVTFKLYPYAQTNFYLVRSCKLRTTGLLLFFSSG